MTLPQNDESDPAWLYIGVERVSYPVLNLGFVRTGLTPGQVKFDLFKVLFTMSIFSHYVLQTTMSFSHMNSLHLNEDQ